MIFFITIPYKNSDKEKGVSIFFTKEGENNVVLKVGKLDDNIEDDLSWVGNDENKFYKNYYNIYKSGDIEFFEMMNIYITGEYDCLPFVLKQMVSNQEIKVKEYWDSDEMYLDESEV